MSPASPARRIQPWLFGVLLLASAAMGAVLWQLREHAHRRLLAGEDTAPTRAPQVSPEERATLLVASDADGSLQARELALPLPQDDESRGRMILGKLLDLYALPGAAHPVPGGAASVAQLFLLPLAAGPKVPAGTPRREPQLAVVNLTSAFAATHPSGIEAETLTVLSLCDTLRANLPRVAQVRFLVDGAPRATLAGHADLSRACLASTFAPPAEERP